MKRTILLCCAFWMAAAWAGAEPASVTNALSLDEIVGEVLRQNPSLLAARAKWEAMRERVPQARAWEDPRVGLDVVAGRFIRVPDDSFTDQKVYAEQTLPITGKNRLRAEASTAEAAVAFEELRERELDLTARARSAFFQMANAIAQREVNRKNADLLRQVVEITRRKYETGSQSQADILMAETELARLDETAFDFRRRISEAQRALNVLMNHPTETILALPGISAVVEEPELDAGKLEALVLACRPELLMARERIAAARVRVSLARKDKFPEPNMRIEASRYNASGQGISELMVGFSINLPWANRAKYSAALREAKKMQESSEHELAALRLEALRHVRDQISKIETFHHHAELFRNRLIPLATQTVNSKRQAYETNKAPFVEWLTAQRNVRDIESMYLDHLTDFRIALAEMEALVGAPLETEAGPKPDPKEIK